MSSGANDHVGNTDLPDFTGIAAGPRLERAQTGISGLGNITGRMLVNVRRLSR